MADGARQISLVVRSPWLPLHPGLQQILDSKRHTVKFISDEELNSDNIKPLVRGILYYGPGGNLSLPECLPNLRVISAVGAGTDHIDIEAATKRGVRVGNTPGVVTDCTADLAFALLLSSARNIVDGDSKSRQPGFSKLSVFNYFGTKVSGSTIGIVGLGGIGTAVANRAKGFNMNILYHSRTRKKEQETCLGAKYCSEIKDLLKESDFVVLCVSLSAATRHMISASELSHMKPTATLINVARGGLVNHDDLVAALKNGVIHGAALDVTEPEPLPHDHPLLALPNVIVVPHIGTLTLATRSKMMEIALENLIAGLNDKELLFSVN